MSNASILERDAWNNHRAIKDSPSNRNPLEVSNNTVLWVPRNHPLMKLGNNGFIIQPTNRSKSDHLDLFGSSSVGWVFWAEMARLRLPSARLVFDLPQHDALAGKDAVWSCI
ncbi:hypothetical protein TNCV_2176071 [Trichonephila clavipes]|uniref:Uncharacterized protein n=1 Tax=Trichonephila clavipes TaxID=2585209 RepID=A0A8X6S384_TRICX|nr:hypothetical protein TNCV_2176071 [Trichonephila clavipes]